MKDEEARPGYMSPLVKQDLAKLDKDGDSRRVALHALKQIVENMEPTSVPRFLAQVSESKDAGGSRSYAISLYEEVARVHGKTIIPMIGRVMRTMTGALSGNGSSPQLHEACAKVAAALVHYTIDSESSAAEAEDILKDVSRPLVDLLTGKLEHVAAGAATCMQALVESEKWKHAPADLVSEVCHRTTTALGDKSFRTVAHMQLARSLATMNPGTLNVYGACLIHAAEEVLSSSTYSWQHRKCAAKMAQAVLAIVDRETLSLEFHSITQVLENCKHDRMPHVRAAVCEALQAAKVIMTRETIKEEDNGDHLGSVSLDPAKEAPHRRTWSPNNYSPSSQDTYNISSYTPPPAACDSASSDPFSTPQIGSAGRMKRSLLFSSRTDTYSVSSVPVPVAALTKDQDAISVKENVDPADLGGSTQDSRGSVSGDYDPAPAFHDKLVGDPGVERNSLDDREFTPTTVSQDHPNGKVESRFSPFEAQITRSFGEAEGDLMAEDEEILSGGSAELGCCAKIGAGTRGFSRFPSALGQFRQESLTPESMGDSEFVQSNTISYRGANSGYSDANGSALPSQMGYSSNGVAEKVVDVLENKQISHMSSLQGVSVDKPSIHDHNAAISHAQYMKLSNNPEDGFSVLKPRVLITTADFLPYSTPRRLVLSLQSELSSPGEEGGNEDQIRRISCGAGTEADHNEDTVRRVDDGTGKRIEFNEDADMDVESSSDSGNWSVRDDILPSDESVTVESSDEGKEERHTNIYETFSRSRKVQSVADRTHGKKNVSPPIQDRGYASDHSRNGDLGCLPAEDTDTRHHTPDANLVCSSCTSSQRKRSARKAQEWDLRSDGDDQSLGAARRSMLFEQVETSSQVSRDYTNDSIDEAEGELKRGWCSLLLRSASRVTSVAEVILGGSLCLVIAVPLSMLLARVLQSPEDSYLVPT